VGPWWFIVFLLKFGGEAASGRFSVSAVPVGNK